MQKLEKWDKSWQSLFSWDKASRNQTLRAFSEKKLFLNMNQKRQKQLPVRRYSTFICPSGKSMHHFIKAKSPFLKIYFFPTWIFFTDIQESQSTRGRRYSLIPPHHFHQLHRYLDISLAITVDSSPLSSWKYEAK